MHDIIDAEIVEVQVDQFGKVWINIDGRCLVRIGRAKTVIIDDPVRGLDVVVDLNKVVDELPAMQ